ncbi:hypothetical protein [Tsukamurella paurometabola]|uniref:Uncharacterized protein n=1 Tax=Tsukamurella paurometabola TaxID=2061 RepID=A0A3P8JXV4_TSUPA|nr:hypothetical protein [Tsukamurella paurometabola]UEA81175.1 hypothetical protein LK411_12170 [Tsukamurella paurometabola]VDR38149.1 Uncharacterised protein [Tsukamurella paurometabola]
MTQGPQPPEFPGQQPGTPPHFQGQPGMPPQFPPPAPPKQSRKTIIIVVIAVVIALIAGAALTFALTRSSQTSGTAAPSAASSSSAISSADYRLRGTMVSKAAVCTAGGLTSQQIPKFAKPLDYSTRPNLDADIEKARQDLSRLASRISPNAAEPIRSTLQDWITSYVDLLDSFSRREPPADITWKGDLVDNLAGQINRICQSN